MENEGDNDGGDGAKLQIDLSSGHRRRRQEETKAWGFWGFWTVFFPSLLQACARMQDNYGNKSGVCQHSCRGDKVCGISGRADE